MTVRADNSNAPLRRATKEAINKKKSLIQEYINQGMNKDEAEAKANNDLRNDKTTT